MLTDRIVDRVAQRLVRELALPRVRLAPLLVDGYEAGYLDAERAQRVARFADVFVADGGVMRFHGRLDSFDARTHAMEAVARALDAEGALTRWRNERYRVSSPMASPLFEIERAAARYFGVATHATHVNATTFHDAERRMWIARRSATKAIDPSMLDNLVGGGVAAGMSITATVAKEAHEEAGIPPSLARGAEAAGTVRIFRSQPDGIQRETVHVFDLQLPADFSPRNEDGEVADYRLAAIDDIADWIGEAHGDNVVTADASLVIVDWMIRRDYILRTHSAFETLDRLRGK